MKKVIFLILLIGGAVSAQAQNSLYTKDTLAVNQIFRQRVKSATIIAANQLASDTTMRSYIYTYVNEIIGNPDGGWIAAMTYQVVANPAITYNSSDGDIQFTVNSNIDKCAKAFSNISPTDINIPAAP